MTTARPIRLQEFTRITKAEKIDREAGVLHDLVILAPESANGRRYSEAAMKKAVGLYEGRPSNANHVKGTGDPSVYDRLGVWHNVRYAADGKLRGDFAFFKSHPLAGQLIEAAERPDLHTAFGFSHDAIGSGRNEGGTALIESIDEVNSIDLVSNPATTKGLRESKEANMTATPPVVNRPKNATGQKTRKTLRTVLTEALLPLASRKKRLAVRTWLKEMEDGNDSLMAPDAPMEAAPGAAGEDMDAEPPGHGEPLFQAICDLIEAAMENVDTSALDPEYTDKLQQIKDICASHGAEGKDADGDYDGDKEGKGEDMAESKRKKPSRAAQQQQLQEENTRLKREAHVRKLCDAAKFVPDEIQLKALLPLTVDDEAKKLIESFQKAAAPAETRRAQIPVSQGAGHSGSANGNGQQQHMQESAPRQGETPDQYRLRRVQEMRSGR